LRAEDTPVLILCGGRGTRLQEKTADMPKPLVEIGGRPIVWHVMSIYAAQGFKRFVLLCGYMGDLIEAFAAATGPASGTVTVPRHRAGHADGRPHPSRRRSAGRQGRSPTYADGVADIDLNALLEFHRRPRRACRDDDGRTAAARGV
jgi:glucose-1-phosphate cytidylyltransferase